MSKNFTARIDASLTARMCAFMQVLGITSRNNFAVRCITALCDMLDTPAEQRTVPALVLMYDAAKKASPSTAQKN